MRNAAFSLVGTKTARSHGLQKRSRQQQICSPADLPENNPGAGPAGVFRFPTAPQNGQPWVKRSEASCGHLPSAFRATALHPSTPNSAPDGVEGFFVSRRLPGPYARLGWPTRPAIFPFPLTGVVLMAETEAQYRHRTARRWKFYNLAFCVFGRTPIWLGPAIWH